MIVNNINAIANRSAVSVNRKSPLGERSATLFLATTIQAPMPRKDAAATIANIINWVNLFMLHLLSFYPAPARRGWIYLFKSRQPILITVARINRMTND